MFAAPLSLSAASASNLFPHHVALGNSAARASMAIRTRFKQLNQVPRPQTITDEPTGHIGNPASRGCRVNNRLQVIKAQLGLRSHHDGLVAVRGKTPWPWYPEGPVGQQIFRIFAAGTKETLGGWGSARPGLGPTAVRFCLHRACWPISPTGNHRKYIASATLLARLSGSILDFDPSCSRSLDQDIFDGRHINVQ